jgi:hypothetical protein
MGHLTVLICQWILFPANGILLLLHGSVCAVLNIMCSSRHLKTKLSLRALKITATQTRGDDSLRHDVASLC